MLSVTDLYPYQSYAKDYILSKNGSMLWLDIGLGKTIIALTAIEALLDQYKAKGALVIAPVKVVEAVWMQEAAKWCHTKRLTFSMVRGTPKERKAALLKPAEIYLINYESIQWLEKTLESLFFKNLPFDIVVFDEISKMKHTTSKRSRAFYKLLPHMTYRVGLTGTPASNGVIDLHGQYMVVDGGARLGPNITSYRERYFTYNQYSRKYQPRRGSTKEIISKITDITIEMAADDYLQLPPLVDVDRTLKLPDDILKQYKEFAKDFFLEINGDELEVFSSSAKSAKERQLANGAVYTNQPGEERAWTVFHDEKLDMLEELVDELNGQPLLVCYQFIHDKIRIKERFPDAVFIDNNNVAPIVEDWTNGKTKILVGHPQSMGHGLNLQYGGNHICWFGLTYNLEHYEQAIGRLLRNGQKKHTVFNHRLLAEGTIEDWISKVISSKDATQDTIRRAVKNYKEVQML